MHEGELLALVFLSALVASFLLTPLARRIALGFNIVALPGERKIHKQPVPYLGGLAIYAAFILGMAIALHNSQTLSAQFLRQLPGLFIACTLVVILGTWDDIKDIKPYLKLLGQILVAVILFSSGLRIDLLRNPVTAVELQMPVFLSLLLTVFWFVGMMNAMNLIDGLDGLAAGITVIASCMLIFVGLYLENYENVFVLAILAAGCLGFLRFNFYPAKIFMGDAGSQFLGMVLSATALIGSQHKAATAVVLLTPLTALALPIYDTFMAIVRRIAKRRSIFRADGLHIHHRLLDLGLTQREIVIFLYLITIYLSLFAFLFILIPKHYAFMLLVLLFLGICMGIAVVDFIERKLRAVIRLEGRRLKK